jgi:DNA-binding NarL/FixJ family response regulator
LDGVPSLPAHAWLTPLWRRRVEADLAALRATLGADAADAAWAAGRATTLEQAVAEALAPYPPAAGDGSRSAPPPAPGGLTAREQEVAALVAGGHSNPQIARALTIAPRTAARHVEHVMAKLGVHSRAEVAAWAAQHGLLGPAGA